MKKSILRFLLGGKCSRCLVQKGGLNGVFHMSKEGQIFKVFNEMNEIVKNVSIFIGKEKFVSNEKDEVVLICSFLFSFVTRLAFLLFFFHVCFNVFWKRKICLLSRLLGFLFNPNVVLLFLFLLAFISSFCSCYWKRLKQYSFVLSFSLFFSVLFSFPFSSKSTIPDSDSSFSILSFLSFSFLFRVFLCFS